MNENTKFLYIVGFLILLLNKIRYKIKGYTTPNLIPEANADEQVNYDLEVVSRWENWLKAYTGETDPFFKKNILELGPGSDIGTGVICIDKGASSYTAYDKNEINMQRNSRVYEILNKKLKNENSRQSLKLFLNGQNSQLAFYSDPNFDLGNLPSNNISLVLSQAAFEHFENFNEFVSALGGKVRPGAILCAEIDLKTHSRWIRDIDPNNIYRFPEWIYKLLNYTGIPNRLRPEDYQYIFENNGWSNIQITTLTTLPPSSVSLKNLDKSFKNKEMRPLTVSLLATKN